MPYPIFELEKKIKENYVVKVDSKCLTQSLKQPQFENRNHLKHVTSQPLKTADSSIFVSQRSVSYLLIFPDISFRKKNLEHNSQHRGNNLYTA